jgi:predicted DNA binding CopG/RHH family protein
MRKSNKTLKPVPEFRSDEEAGEFWMTHDTTEYLDWSTARRVRFPKLRPSTATISLRLPQMLLDELRMLANQRDVPYQSLLKVYLAERVAAERGNKPSRGRTSACSRRSRGAGTLSPSSAAASGLKRPGCSGDDPSLYPGLAPRYVNT